MSDLSIPPKPHIDNVAAIADFAELECLRRDDANVSVTDIARIIQREPDEITEDSAFERVVEAFGELENRIRHCGDDLGCYPFQLLDSGEVLQFKRPSKSTAKPSLTYLYLLLATRMNMTKDRSQGGEDATKLFEELCSEVALRFLGGPGPGIHAIVFGTGRLPEHHDLNDEAELDKGVFQLAVDQLCSVLKEGFQFQAYSASTRVKAKDGKLDVVAWRSFADQRPGQLIGFGQCKTGRSWHRNLRDIQPEEFCKKWMLKSPAVIPVRMFFVADRIAPDRSRGDRADDEHGIWYEHCAAAGILFDRCRIMEFAHRHNDLPKSLVGRISKWVKAATKAEGLRIT